MGPREGEYAAPADEHQVTIRLTRDFEIGQTEFTRAQWKALALPAPEVNPNLKDPPAPCTADDCPVQFITWYEALAAANAFSSAHDLPECYVLSGCTGTLGGVAGDMFQCESVSQTVDNIYECAGYRLPTEFEWEYAARAGTQTAFHQGDISPNGDAVASQIACYADAKLGVSDWYCMNSDRGAKAVARKMPNRWGVYDVLGNVAEYTSTTFFALPPEPESDPQESLDGERWAVSVRAGSFIGGPGPGRVATRLGKHKIGDGPTHGFRLARTL
jgi:formylglycine-generating enzyme required for sulfatase activity